MHICWACRWLFCYNTMFFWETSGRRHSCECHLPLLPRTHCWRRGTTLIGRAVADNRRIVRRTTPLLFFAIFRLQRKESEVAQSPDTLLHNLTEPLWDPHNTENNVSASISPKPIQQLPKDLESMSQLFLDNRGVPNMGEFFFFFWIVYKFSGLYNLRALWHN